MGVKSFLWLANTHCRNIESVIAVRYNIENIDRISNSASDDVCNHVDDAQKTTSM